MSSTKAPINDAVRPDGWSRFERAVDAAVKGGPRHKAAPMAVSKKERPASKGRVHKGKTRS